MPSKKSALRPAMMIPRITYLDHRLGAETMKLFYPGLTVKDLPGAWLGTGILESRPCGYAHGCPLAYHPTQDMAPCAHHRPVSPPWAVGRGVKGGFSQNPWILYPPADIKGEPTASAMRAGRGISLPRAGPHHLGQGGLLVKGCGFVPGSDPGARGQGCMLWERTPGAGQAAALPGEDFERTKTLRLIWEGHFAGSRRGISDREVTNLEGSRQRVLPLLLPIRQGGQRRGDQGRGGMD